MKKVFFDTEFTGLHQNTTLISVGLIAETGQTFYAELNDYDESQVDEWLRKNVIAKLKFAPPGPGEQEHFSWARGGAAVELRGDTSTVARYLADWFQELLGGPLSWVDYANFGHVPVEPPRLVEEPQIQLVSDCHHYDIVLLHNLWDHAFNMPKCVHYIPMDICPLLEAAGVDPDVNREEFARMTDGAEKHNALWDARVIRACYRRVNRILGRAMDEELRK